ncbi:MAG: CatB-related O-acetyltransferase [Bacteroidales bacterium]|jgi:acetyltransferase-like isoleucine patch superfamily enzyme|nr:CatB-related O-acetyltransferase [Bacteroidales bacterium]
MMKLLKRLYITLFALYHKYFSGKRILIARKVKLNSHTKLEGFNKIDERVNISYSFLGRGTYIGGFSKLESGIIGRFCCIAPYVEVIYGQHPLGNYVSVHPAFYSLLKQGGFTFVENQKFQDFDLIDGKYSFVIGNDVWLGYGVKIMEGLTVGDGAVVAAGSVVTNNIPPYEIWGGVPARKIKDRFPDEIKCKLDEIKWWNFDMNKLKTQAYLFTDIDKFITYYRI